MKQKLAKLIDVKSIVTILLTIVFGVMSALGRIEGDQFLTIYTVVISFYFGVQFQKHSEGGT